MGYAATHANALATAKRKGEAVTFSLANPGTHTPSTGTFSGAATSTVTGYAVRSRGDPKVYEALKLTPREAPTLFFVPSTYGQLPAMNAKVPFESVTYTVRSIDPIAPDGTAIAARVVVAK